MGFAFSVVTEFQIEININLVFRIDLHNCKYGSLINCKIIGVGRLIKKLESGTRELPALC